LFNKDHCSVYHEVIRWSSSGQSILILNRQKLASVLKNYYKSNSIESFKRQLNLYGFTRVKGDKCIKFRHPSFSKHNPEDLWKINKQSKPKQTQSYSISDSELEELSSETGIVVKIQEEIKEMEKENKQLEERLLEDDNLFETLQNKFFLIEQQFINKRTDGLANLIKKFQKDLVSMDKELRLSNKDQVLLIQKMVNEFDRLTGKSETFSIYNYETETHLNVNELVREGKETNQSQTTLKFSSNLGQNKLFDQFDHSLKSNDFYFDQDCELSVCHDVE
jgi:DNA gyrase/topoisomerase IV subunit A